MSKQWPDSNTFRRDKRVIVTGGSGFLGSFVVDKLRARGASWTPAGRGAIWLREPDAVRGWAAADD